MPWFRCLIEGENFPLAREGRPALLGFFTTRWVEAATSGEAERQAVDMIRGDKAFARMREANLTPMIYVRRMDEVPEPSDGPGEGFTFFPMEG